MYALLSAIATACAVILASMGLNGMNPVSAATLNTAITTCFLIIANLALNKWGSESIFSIGKTEGIYIVFAGIANGLAWIFYSTALKHGLTSKVTAVDQLSIVFTLGLCAVVLGEYQSIYCIFGSILMSLGVYFISL